MTLPLTPAELDAIAQAAVALAPGRRVAFAHMVESELALLPEAARGEGSLHQLIERCQKSFALANEIVVGPGHAKFGWPHPHHAKAK
jgi:hypothetical protein